MCRECKENMSVLYHDELCARQLEKCPCKKGIEQEKMPDNKTLIQHGSPIVICEIIPLQQYDNLKVTLCHL